MPLHSRSLASRIVWFGLAGASGFAIDAGVLMLLVACGLDSRIARLFSFACAIVVTWLINRSRAFGDRTGAPSLAEFLRYVSASMLAALVNLGTFMALVTFGGVFAAWPILAVAIATSLSMSVNFWSYQNVVFAKERDCHQDKPVHPRDLGGPVA